MNKIFLPFLLMFLAFLFISGCGENQTVKDVFIYATGDEDIDPNTISDYPLAYEDINSISFPTYKVFDTHTNSGQGSLGSCVAYSSCNSRSVLFNQKYQLPFNPENVLNPMMFYKLCVYEQDKNWGEGLNLQKAQDLMVRFGSNSYNVVNYTSETPQSEIITEGIDNYKFRLDNYRSVSLKDIKYIKYELLKNRPVVFSMKLYTDFGNYTSGVYTGNGKYAYSSDWSLIPLSHAMCIIGYNDDLQAFRVMNSWGDNWGENGNVWISYQTLLKEAKVAFVGDSYFNSPPSSEYIDWNILIDCEVEKTYTLSNSLKYLFVQFNFNKPVLLNSITLIKDGNYSQKYGFWYKKGDIYFSSNLPFSGDYEIEFNVTDNGKNLKFSKNFSILNSSNIIGNNINKENLKIYGMNGKLTF